MMFIQTLELELELDCWYSRATNLRTNSPSKSNIIWWRLWFNFVGRWIKSILNTFHIPVSQASRDLFKFTSINNPILIMALRYGCEPKVAILFSAHKKQRAAFQLKWVSHIYGIIKSVNSTKIQSKYGNTHYDFESLTVIQLSEVKVKQTEHHFTLNKRFPWIQRIHDVRFKSYGDVKMTL